MLAVAGFYFFFNPEQQRHFSKFLPASHSKWTASCITACVTNGVRVEEYQLEDTAGESSGGQGLCHAMSLRWPPHSYLERVYHTHSYACAPTLPCLYLALPTSASRAKGQKLANAPRDVCGNAFKSQRPEPWTSHCVWAWMISAGVHHSKKHRQSINSVGQWLFVMRNDDAAAAMTKYSTDLMAPWHWLRLLSQLSVTK